MKRDGISFGFNWIQSLVHGSGRSLADVTEHECTCISVSYRLYCVTVPLLPCPLTLPFTTYVRVMSHSFARRRSV